MNFTVVASIFCYFELIGNMVLGQNTCQKLYIVGFCCRKGVSELLGFDIFFRAFLLLSSCSDMYSEMSNDWDSKRRDGIGFRGDWVGCHGCR